MIYNFGNPKVQGLFGKFEAYYNFFFWKIEACESLKFLKNCRVFINFSKIPNLWTSENKKTKLSAALFFLLKIIYYSLNFISNTNKKIRKFQKKRRIYRLNTIPCPFSAIPTTITPFASSTIFPSALASRWPSTCWLGTKSTSPSPRSSMRSGANSSNGLWLVPQRRPMPSTPWFFFWNFIQDFLMYFAYNWKQNFSQFP